jgi:hypothetical protein
MVLLALNAGTADGTLRKPKHVLRRSRELAGRLESGEAQANPAAWRDDAAETLRLLLWTSTVPGGQMAVPLVPEGQELVQQMRGWAGGELPLPEAETMRDWVRTLEEIYRRGRRLSSPPPTPQQRARARQVLQLELGGSAYTEARDSGTSLSQRLANLAARYVMDPLFGKRTGAARQILLVICCVLLGLLLAHVIWELARARGAGTGRRDASATVSREEMLTSARTPGQFLDRGDAAREEGNLLRAMGLYYLALLTALARAGCTDLDRSLTNWEHYRRTSRSGRLQPGQLDRLAEVTEFFDRRCYGTHAASREDVTHLREQVHQMINTTSS